MSGRKLIAHIIHRLDFGGLENGLVNLINRIPPDRYHHAIICMTEYTDFADRITNPEVTLHSLNKAEGKDLSVYLSLWKLLRQLKPDVVHTRNLSAVEGSVIAWLAGVSKRVHGEHGRDSYDIDGTNPKYLMLRKICKPFTNLYIPLSKDLEYWLESLVQVPEDKIRQIYNGVDSLRFKPSVNVREGLPINGFADESDFVVGTVGRIQEVKDQITLIKSIALLLDKNNAYRLSLRLVLVGDGPMMPEVASLVKEKGIEDITWLTGARNDIPELLQAMDLFVLPSKAEGISNTILEAMASGLPVLATDVGGNGELVQHGVTGELVPAENPDEMSLSIERYMNDKDRCLQHGEAGRKRVEEMFSIDSMVDAYLSVYDELSA
ncbi:MAG: TIGR03088 family PEP-CTERM/XrtA system glycosyltransferase [Sedimenticola sp.]